MHAYTQFPFGLKSSSAFHSARCDQHSTNTGPPLILDSIQLPSKMLLRSRSYVTNLYIKRDLPIREIARQINVSHSTVIECLRRLGIHDKVPKKRVITQGQIPFGFDYKNGKLEKNKEEQEVIRIIKQLRSSGLSLREIARELNKRLIPTKKNGIWQGATVSTILSRVGTQKMV
jgi:IS30 family transposase